MKICPQCRAKNAAQKNFCDACGTPLSAPAAPDPDIPQTARQRFEERAEPAGGLPAAGRSRQSYEPPPPTPVAPPRTSTRQRRSLMPHGVGYVLHGAFALLLLLAVAGLALYAALQLWRRSGPETEALGAASEHLTLWSQAAVGLCYGLMTMPARDATSPDELRELRGAASWSWSNLRLLKAEPETLFFSYDAATPGAAATRETLRLVHEGGRWLRPFNGSAARKAAAALARGEADRAVLHAQTAAMIDPRDPRARSLLCAALKARGLTAAAESECAAAAAAARAQPAP